MRHAVVIGSGRMAPGIAAACAATGARVTIAARNAAKAQEAARVAARLVGRPLAAAGLEAASFSRADLAIETIVEDLQAKSDLLERIEGWLPERAILATNTSSLPLDSLAGRLARPERFAGLHFLHPANATHVVEIVPAAATATEAQEALADLVRRMGKQPIPLRRDIPGFLWNRLQFALLRECLHLIDADVADIATIDAAVSDGLAPRWLSGGPLATADLGGLRTFQRVAERLFPLIASETKVSGALAGDGFYRWTETQRRQMEAFRAEVLAATQSVSERRRTTMPAPNEWQSDGPPADPAP